MNLQNKTALITGGGTGIGAAIALALATEGVHVMIVDRRAEVLANTAEAISNSHGVAFFETCDVRKPDDCEQLMRRTTERLGPIDILVNNAGVSGHGKFLAAHSPDEWDLIIGTNLKSSFLLTRAVLPGMVSRGWGYIINLSSVSGVRCYPSESIYGVSKHALNALTQYIIEEYGSQGIRALALCPGLVRTDMGLNLNPQRLERLLAPEHIAGAIVWALKWDGRALVIAEA
jgi:3-oxoacyl-[acyl-carrier protein] reductase